MFLPGQWIRVPPIAVGKSPSTLFTPVPINPTWTQMWPSMKPHFNQKDISRFLQPLRSSSKYYPAHQRHCKHAALTAEHLGLLLPACRSSIDIRDHTEDSKCIIQYSSPDWFSKASRSSIAKLEFVKNAALQAITGYHRTASVSHLYQEASALQLENSLSLLSKQYPGLSRLGPSITKYSNHWLGTPKNKQSSNFIFALTSSAIHDGHLAQSARQDTVNALHCNALSGYISNTDPNNFFNVYAVPPPPPISPEE